MSLRLIKILAALPRAPGALTSQEILDRVCDLGDKPSLRTIQRDLGMLLNLQSLGLERIQGNGPGRQETKYCYAKDARGLGPEMDDHTAIAVVLLEKFAQQLMPAQTVQAIAPTVQQAKNSLSRQANPLHQRAQLHSWEAKVRSAPRGLFFKKPVIREDVYEGVTKALLENLKLDITYKGKPGYRLHPWALIDRGLEIILVAYVERYQEHRQFMLHRIDELKVLTNTRFEVDESFDIDELIATGYFAVPRNNDATQQIELELRLFEEDRTPSAIWDVDGMELSDDQTIEWAEDKSSARVTATVNDTHEFRTWLLGLGSRVEILKPKSLCEDIRKTMKRAIARYD